MSITTTYHIGKVSSLGNSLSISVTTDGNQLNVILHAHDRDGRKSGVCLFLNECEFIKLKELLEDAQTQIISIKKDLSIQPKEDSWKQQYVK